MFKKHIKVCINTFRKIILSKMIEQIFYENLSVEQKMCPSYQKRCHLVSYTHLLLFSSLVATIISDLTRKTDSYMIADKANLVIQLTGGILLILGFYYSIKAEKEEQHIKSNKKLKIQSNDKEEVIKYFPSIQSVDDFFQQQVSSEKEKEA